MKYAFVIARVLLGLVFTVFGLNGLLHFFQNPPVPVSRDSSWELYWARITT